MGTFSVTVDLPDRTTDSFAPAASLGITPSLSTEDGGSGVPAEVARRLEEFAALASDWDGYGARQIDRRALELARVLVWRFLEQGLPVPEIFPVPDGGVQIEWEAGPLELELEVEPGALSAVFVCDDRAIDRRFDGELPADLNRFRLAMQRLAAHA